MLYFFVQGNIHIVFVLFYNILMNVFKTTRTEQKPSDLPCKYRTDEQNLHFLSINHQATWQQRISCHFRPLVWTLCDHLSLQPSHQTPGYFLRISPWWWTKDSREFHAESCILPDLENLSNVFSAFQGTSTENDINICWVRDHT